MNTHRSIEKIVLQNDTRNISSLENFLKPNFINSAAKIILKNKGTVFIISHDRYFISKVANRIIEIKESRLLSYDGNYEYFLEKTRINQ